MMLARCGHCRVKIRLNTRSTEAGKRIRFACPKCGVRLSTTVPEARSSDLLLDILSGRVRLEDTPGWENGGAS